MFLLYSIEGKTILILEINRYDKMEKSWEDLNVGNQYGTHKTRSRTTKVLHVALRANLSASWCVRAA